MLKLDEYKFSKYNHKILLENKLYLYNAYLVCYPSRGQ